LGTGAPPPWRSREYVLVNILYISSKAAVYSSFHLMKQYSPHGHLGQGGITHARFPVVAEQVSNYATNNSHSFQGTSGTKRAAEQPRINSLPFGNFPTAGLVMKREENSSPYSSERFLFA